MATGQEVFDAARLLNRKTQEDALVSSVGTEVVNAINRSLRGIYQVAARVNPSYYGKTSSASESSGTWSKPSDLELLYLVRDASGNEVFVTDPRDPLPDPEVPCVQKWGASFTRPAGASIPTGSLTLYYSRRPSELSALAGTVDLEDQFVSLLVYDIGAWIAHKDERFDELPVLQGDLEKYLRLFVSSLEHEIADLTRNVGQTARFDSPSLVDLKTFLLGFQPTG